MIGARRSASTKPKQGADSFAARLLGASILAFPLRLTPAVVNRVHRPAAGFATSNSFQLKSWNAIGSLLQYSRPISPHPNLSYKAVSVH